VFLLPGPARSQQSAANPLEFEVASVKPSSPPFDFSQLGKENGKINFRNVTLMDCLAAAYNIDQRQILGPDWLDTQRYMILATAAPGTSAGRLMLMLQPLLAERFHVTLHREKKELNSYALVQTKNGLKLHKSEAGELIIVRMRDTPNGWSFKHVSMAGLAAFLSGPFARTDQALDRQIVDRTDLDGDFDFNLVWTPRS
jgi:uncharacterized protein (TIGR03435 family)